jgi:hypothetical protein
MCLGSRCDSGQYHDDKDSKKMICAVCKFATCTGHGLPWHEGQSCEEYDEVIDKAVVEADKDQKAHAADAARTKAAKKKQQLKLNLSGRKLCRELRRPNGERLKLKHLKLRERKLSPMRQLKLLLSFSESLITLHRREL